MIFSYLFLSGSRPHHYMFRTKAKWWVHNDNKSTTVKTSKVGNTFYVKTTYETTKIL